MHTQENLINCSGVERAHALKLENERCEARRAATHQEEQMRTRFLNAFDKLASKYFNLSLFSISSFSPEELEDIAREFYRKSKTRAFIQKIILRSMGCVLFMPLGATITLPFFTKVDFEIIALFFALSLVIAILGLIPFVLIYPSVQLKVDFIAIEYEFTYDYMKNKHGNRLGSELKKLIAAELNKRQQK